MRKQNLAAFFVTKQGEEMKRILTVIVMLMLISVSAYADPTPEQILQKVADNMGLVQDMKATAVYNGSFQGNPYPPNEIRLFWAKKPDKSKIIYLKNGYTEITNGDTLYQIDKSTTTIDLATFGVPTKQLDYYYNLGEFLSHHSLFLINTALINGDTVYTLEVKPLEANDLYSKIVFSINYNKGLVAKKELYDTTEYKASTEELISFQAFTINSDTVYYPVKKRMTMHFDDGEIISEVEYKDIQFNTGLSDTMFEVK